MRMLVIVFCCLMTSTLLGAKPNLSEQEIIQLRVDMAGLVARDQAIRSEIMHLQKKYDHDFLNSHKEITQYWRKVDQLNSQEIKKLITRYGWPDQKIIGKQYCHDVWLLVQHADQDLILQQLALRSLKANAGHDQDALKQYAYLYDRIQVHKNLPQRYGTQGYCVKVHNWQPFLLEDKTHLDQLRNKVGLNSFVFYKKQLDQFCH